MAPLPGQKPINLLESPAVAWIAPNAKEIFIGQSWIQNPAMGFPWGEVVVIVSCEVIPTVAQKNRAKNTPATRMKKAMRHRLGKFPQQITPPPGDRRQNEALQEPARWGSHSSLAASLVRGPCSSWGFSSREVGLTFSASGRAALK